MSAQHITSTVPARRLGRLTAAVVAIAVVIAAGGYVATQTIGPDAREPSRSEFVTPTDQALRELRESVARQYGAPAQPRSELALPGAQVQQDLGDSVAGQYGGAR